MRTRTRRIWIVILLLVLIGLGSLLFVLPPVPSATKSGLTPRESPFCIQGHFDYSTMSFAEVDKQAKLISELGDHCVRFDAVWGAIQTDCGSPPTVTWTRYDRIFQILSKYRIHALITFAQWDVPPCYSASIPASEATQWAQWQMPIAPSGLSAFKTFVSTFVLRYEDQISEAEVGNEANNAQFWPPSPNANAYVAFLNAGYAGIKAVSNIRVISAGLENEGDWQSFLIVILKDGEFDDVGYHPYSQPNGVDSPKFQNLAKVYALMLQYKQGDKKIAVTEIGWPTSQTPDGVSIAQEAKNLTAVYTAILTGPYKTYVVLACWYEFKDEGFDPSNAGDHFGMVDVNDNPKGRGSSSPYYAFQAEVVYFSQHFTPINP